MKNLPQLLAVASMMTLLFVVCTQPTRDQQIVGKWNYDHVDAVATNNDKPLTPIDKIQIEYMDGLLKQTSIEFFRDKTFIIPKLNSFAKKSHVFSYEYNSF